MVPIKIGLHCAPLTCVVDHGAQGVPMSVRSRGRPRQKCEIFHFQPTAEMRSKATRSRSMVTRSRSKVARSSVFL